MVWVGLGGGWLFVHFSHCHSPSLEILLVSPCNSSKLCLQREASDSWEQLKDPMMQVIYLFIQTSLPFAFSTTAWYWPIWRLWPFLLPGLYPELLQSHSLSISCLWSWLFLAKCSTLYLHLPILLLCFSDSLSKALNSILTAFPRLESSVNFIKTMGYSSQCWLKKQENWNLSLKSMSLNLDKNHCSEWV